MAKIVKASDLNVARRGRKANRIASVLEAMRELQPGDAAILEEFGEVADEDKSRIRQSVKSHWDSVRTEAPHISFDPETRIFQIELLEAKKGKAKRTK